MIGNVADLNSVEIKDLTPRQDGRDHLVFFCRCQNENGVWRRFFQSLQKGIKSLIGEHVNLIYDIDLESSELWWIANLVNQVSDIIDRVVGCGIKLKYVQ